MKITWRRILPVCIVLMAIPLFAQQGMPKTTKENIPGPQSIKTEQLKGTVVAVDGSHLAVAMSTGELRSFNVPPSRKFLVDGKELTVGELKPGTKLTATVTTTTTTSTERTTTVGSGKVWHVSGNSVIVTLPNNENRMYNVDENYRFIVNGEKASVHDLRKGMIISAEKIVEEPKTEIVSNTVVIGVAPPPPAAKAAPAPKMMPPAPARAPEPTPVAAPKPSPMAAAPAPPPTPPAPARAARAEEAAPAELPKTASQVPLIGLIGLTALAAWFFMRSLRPL